MKSYREAMADFAKMTNLDVWYARLDVEKVFNEYRSRATPSEIKRFERNLAKAQAKDNMKAFAKLTERVDGEYRIKADPPVVVPLTDLLPEGDLEDMRAWLEDRVRVYRRTLQPDRRRLLESYRLVDFARKVVGVGSVGRGAGSHCSSAATPTTRCSSRSRKPRTSVLEAHAGRSGFANHGQRVVEGQRLVQAASDILLGWTRTVGLDGVERDFYLRQLWDGKFSADIDSMSPSALDIYARLCGWTLARAHARSGDRVAIAAYLGSNDAFDKAMVEFSAAYADQNERDYATVSDALQAKEVAPAARS